MLAALLLAAVQEPPKPAPPPLAVTVEGNIPAELAPVAGELTKLFYESYPRLLKRFDNPDKPGPRQVRVVFRDNLRVPAQCSGNTVEVSADWLRKHPDDAALLVHELTHAVQRYPRGGPGWLTEGIADYARQEYGPKEQGGWKLPAKLTAKQKHTDSYRVTARFLVWLEARSPGTVDKLHRAMQAGGYTPAVWEQAAGRPVEALWDECVSELGKP